MSLALATPQGLVVVAGCSHPGIENILRAANAIEPRLAGLFGGLHLVLTAETEVQRIALRLRDEFKLQRIAPGHCTGEPAFAALQAAFGEPRSPSMTASHQAGVIGFYDTHPINETETRAKLRARGLADEAVTEREMSEFDQDHYGGVPALEALADEAGISAATRVLDTCSGMGGPARWLALQRGCRVTGLDLTASRVEGARRLTQWVRLDRLVDFEHGDATAMPFAEASFDVAIGQESWCHIPDKNALIGECARVLRPGGTLAFSDILTTGALAADDEARLQAGMQMPRPAALVDYLALLERHHFSLVSGTDLSPSWQRILVDRLAMYRSLRDTTVAQFGLARFESYDRAYAHFVGLFSAGALGGARVCARRAA